MFDSNRNGRVYNLYLKNSGGTGADELLLKSDHNKRVQDWSADGRFILYRDVDPNTKDDLWVLPLDGDRKPIPFLQTPFREVRGRFSPDGHWIAYNSDESGRDEVYVQSFPPSAGKWQISTSGGEQPMWGRDGKELFYVNANRSALMAVDVSHSAAGVPFKAGMPRELFRAQFANNSLSYDISRDGRRFITNARLTETTNVSPINVLLNWTAALNKK